MNSFKTLLNFAQPLTFSKKFFFGNYKPPIFEKKQYNRVTTYYRAGCICNDCTKSRATGSGACSHHGGVDKWIYLPAAGGGILYEKY